MKHLKFWIIGLLSFTILATELFWTRIFSAEFFYAFAFLILSLAVLGLGLGALFHKLFPRSNNSRLLSVWLSLTGLLIVIAVPLVFSLNIDFSKLVSDPLQSLKLAGMIVLLGSGFFFGGIALAHLLKTNPDTIPKLYTADFLGASTGVLGFIAVMNIWGADVTLMVCILPVLLAAFLTANRWARLLPTIILLGSGAYYITAGGMPYMEREERARVIYTHWDATAKLKVFEFDSTARGLNIDNLANSPVYRFDGNWNRPDSEKFGFAIDVSHLIGQFPRCTFLSLGAGGGMDVLQALQYNAAEIHAVEVIPHINYLMTEGFLKEYTGNIYADPRVKVITEDARVYVRRFTNKFDIIYSLSSNTFAAFASGSFALAENYLYTTEAFQDYWEALSDSGYLMMEHQFYAPRLVTQCLDALDRMGVDNPRSHVAVYNLPTLRRKILLLSKKPLSQETLDNAFGPPTPERLAFLHLLYPPLANNRGNLYHTIVENGWRSAADTVAIDISPCTDDRPFIAQQGLMRNFSFASLSKIPMYEMTGFPLAKSIIVVILVVCTLIVIPLNLLPYLRKGDKLGVRPWLYFFFIGAGYMMIEVVLIQQYALFIGSTIHSLALVLTVLLVSSGVGSRFSGRFSPLLIFPAIAIWLAVDIFVFRQLFYILETLPLVPRLAVSGALLAPLGFFMGMPFPKAASSLPHLVDWGFAVNGSASVIGSVVIILIASTFGYSVALATGGVMYVAAYALYGRVLSR